MTRKLQGKNNKTNPNIILPNPNMSKKSSCQNRPKTCLDITQYNPPKLPEIKHVRRKHILENQFLTAASVSATAES